MHQRKPHEGRPRAPAQRERPGVVVEMNSLARAREHREDRPLKCVASSHLAGGCSCLATIPARVAEASWSRAQARSTGTPEGFFNFNWQGETWLAFGLAGGEVRGVICPTHRAERETTALRSAY